MEETQNVIEGVVYTETVIYSPPAQHLADAPYQIAIVDAGTERLTVRISANDPSDRVRIGDRVIFVEERDGVPYFRRLQSS